MTQETNNLIGSESGVADSELGRMLSDAYEAPPVPRSLHKRIDRLVVAEWGQSPQLAGSRTSRLSGALTRGTRMAKAVPVAASLALFIVLAVVFSSGSRAFAWSSVIEALMKEGVVQTQGSNGPRWLSLNEGLLGERTAEASRLLDVRQGVLLERSEGAPEVRRPKLRSMWSARSASGKQLAERVDHISAADRDRLLLLFLLGGAVSEDDWQRFAGAHVVEERWERVTRDDREHVVLHVQVETATAERFGLDIILDPESQLPLRCDVSRSDRPVRSLALSYPSIDVAELREQEFPADLPVVDLTAHDESRKRHGDSPRLPLSASLRPSQDSAVSAVGDPAPDGARLVTAAKSEPASDEPPMSGAPSTWKPVKVAKRSEGDVRQRLDSLLEELWRENGVEPAPSADDEEILRRVYLDLAGRTPTVHEVRAYLNDTSGNRYQRLVDRLLSSPDHASHLATTWRRFLIPDGVDLADFGGVEAFDRWLAERFAKNVPYDELVRSLLLAEGRLSRSGPLLFYSGVKLDPDKIAARTARVFLGMRLECAQCHDHPFESWTQRDFWGFAAFFARISRPQTELESVSTVMRVRDVDRGEVMLPETETVVAPKFLGAGNSVPDTGSVRDTEASARRERLARWLTSPGNPYFARAAVNRVWAHMFGKGIVDPVDDFGELNPPKSPELLDLLAGHFIGTNFDLRELFRAVALSRAYRLSSGAATADEERLEWFAQMNVKTLTAEQVYDCITVATMLDTQPKGNPSEYNINRFNNTEREIFLQQFRTPAGRRTEYHGGIPQALTLMNGTLIENATGLSRSGLLKSLEAPFFTNPQRIEVLYLATLSRRPRPSEWQVLNGYLPAEASGAERQEALADLLWALLNSAEFTMNH